MAERQEAYGGVGVGECRQALAVNVKRFVEARVGQHGSFGFAGGAGGVYYGYRVGFDSAAAPLLYFAGSSLRCVGSGFHEVAVGDGRRVVGVGSYIFKRHYLS